MLKTNFKNSITKSFYDKFSSFSDTKNYLFIGKVTEWEDDTIPPVSVDSLNEELNAWKNMLACKRINADDVAFVIKKINWNYNTVYQQYDDILDLFSETTPLQFYVLTSENNVYKCIFNNNRAPSQYEPYGTGLEEIITQDGYIWKYMYSVRPELEDFVTEEYIPVEFLDELSYTDQRYLQLDVQQDAKINKNGSISNIVVTQIGAPYSFAIDYDTIEVDGSIAHLVQLNVVAGTSSIKFNTNTNISRMDNVYNDNYVVYIYSGPGSGQVRTIISYNGTTGVAVVDQPFTENISTSSYYKILPKIEIIGNGTGVVAVPVINPLTKQIDHISVLNGGLNYKEAIATVKTTKTLNSEKTLVRVIISPFNGHGSNPLIELGCKNLMIKTKFIKNIENLNFYNDYRQVGLIQNISILGEEEQEQTYAIDIENINSTTSMVLQGNYQQFVGILQQNPDLIVKQGSDNNISQARGSFLSFNEQTKTLILRTINGKFSAFPASTVYPMVIENWPIDGSDTTFDDISIINTSPLNYYNDFTFLPNETILGETSKSTAEIVNWTPKFFGTDGTLVIKKLKGTLIESYYNDSGQLINGENIISFSSVNTNSGIQGFSNSKVGVIKNLYRTQVQEGLNTFRATTVITIVRPAGIDTPFTKTDFSEDDGIKQLTTNAEATVVGWSVSDNGTIGTLMVSGTFNSFQTNTNLGYKLQKLINGAYSTQDAVITQIILPQVIKYSGKIIYIKNIRPVVRGDDQEEEIKLIIGF